MSGCKELARLHLEAAIEDLQTALALGLPKAARTLTEAAETAAVDAWWELS